MGAQMKGGAHDDQVKHGGRGIHNQLAAASGSHDSAQISRIDQGHGDDAALPEKAARALRVAVAAPNGMSLPLQELREKGAGGAGAQNEDPHGVGKLYHISRKVLAAPNHPIAYGEL
jgi:hypothetical protein